MQDVPMKTGILIFQIDKFSIQLKLVKKSFLKYPMYMSKITALLNQMNKEMDLCRLYSSVPPGYRTLNNA